MTRSRRASVLVVAACAAAVLLSACGEEADLRTDRPDVTMAPPPSGDHAAPAATKQKKSTAGHSAKQKKKKKAATSSPARWQRVTDRRSGINFLLPSAVDPTVTPLPVAGAVQRSYVSVPGDGSQVLVAVADIPGVRTLDVDAAIASGISRLQQEGATQVRTRGRRTLSVAGHRAAEFQLSFAKGSASGFAVFRLVLLDNRVLLTGVAAPATGVEDLARRDSLRLQARLNHGLRLG